MGLWRNITRLGGIGAIQGVQEPGPTDVLTPVQTVQIVDDVSYAVRPLQVPVTSFYPDIPVGGAGERGAFAFKPGPRGSVLRVVYGSNGISAGVTSDLVIGPVAPGTLAGLLDTAGGDLTFNSWSRDPRFAPLSTCVALGSWAQNPSALVSLHMCFVDVNYHVLDFFVDDTVEVIFSNAQTNTRFYIRLDVQDIPE